METRKQYIKKAIDQQAEHNTVFHSPTLSMLSKFLIYVHTLSRIHQAWNAMTSITQTSKSGFVREDFAFDETGLTSEVSTRRAETPGIRRQHTCTASYTFFFFFSLSFLTDARPKVHRHEGRARRLPVLYPGLSILPSLVSSPLRPPSLFFFLFFLYRARQRGRGPIRFECTFARGKNRSDAESEPLVKSASSGHFFFLRF